MKKSIRTFLLISFLSVSVIYCEENNDKDGIDDEVLSDENSVEYWYRRGSSNDDDNHRRNDNRRRDYRRRRTDGGKPTLSPDSRRRHDWRRSTINPTTRPTVPTTNPHVSTTVGDSRRRRRYWDSCKVSGKIVIF